MLLTPRHSHPGPVIRALRSFRRWRVGRPFWGGLLTLLAGLEIFGTTQMGGDGLRLQVGPTGFLSWLIPTILIACGLLLWFSPQQRFFYAVVAVMTSVFSLVAVNLGGFFVGLFLGMVGGALGFAWTPAAVPADPPPGAVPAEPPPDADPTTTAERESGNPPTTGMFVLLVLAACLAATGITAVGTAATAHAAPCRSVGATRTAGPAPASPGTPAVAAPAPARTSPARTSPARTSPARTSPAPTSPAPTSPAPTPSAPTGLGLAGTTEPTPIPIPTPEPTRTRTPAPGNPGGCPSARPSASTDPVDPPEVPRLAAEPGQPMVNREPSRLTGSRVTMYGLRLDGIVELPTVDGPLRTLRFSMRRAVTDDFDLRIPGPSGPQTMGFRSSALTVDGDVRFYATSFSGRFLGIPITLTPDSPVPPDGIPLAVPRIAFDDPQMRLAFVECDRLTAPDLDEEVF